MSKRSFTEYSSPTRQYQKREPTQLSAPVMALANLPQSKLLESLGVTPKYVLNEFMKIVNQDDDLSNKLKAIKPLMKELGVDIDGTAAQGITNNIIVMPAEITKKFNLNPINVIPDAPASPTVHEIINSEESPIEEELNAK